jgi:hypothetical protein
VCDRCLALAFKLEKDCLCINAVYSVHLSYPISKNKGKERMGRNGRNVNETEGRGGLIATGLGAKLAGTTAY